MMQWRNPVYAADGRINVEVNHPTFGWVPFTASPNDVEAHGREIFAAASEGPVAPYVPPPAPTPAELLAAERATMRCRRPQARIALGPAMWSQVLAIAADPLTPWALRVWIEDFTELERMSQTTLDLAAALGLTDEQVDDLFRAAMQITA
jgi:hypothetical protein